MRFSDQRRDKGSKFMNDAGVVALGPSNQGVKATGGAKRFRASIKAAEKKFERVTVCSGFLDVLKTLRQKNIYYAFDERYLVLAILPFLLNRQVIFFPRGNKLMHYREHFGAGRLVVYRCIFGLLYRMCCLMVFQTNAQALEFKKTYRFKCGYSVLNNNINSGWVGKGEFVRSVAKTKAFRIGFCGDDSYNKGFSFLYDSIREGVELGRFELHVAGDVPAPEGAGDGVVFYGYVSDIKSLLKNVDVLVVPSIYDSFPNVLLEALFYKVPVLMSRNPISEEILRGSGVVFLFERTKDGLLERLDSVVNKKFDCFLALSEVREMYSFSWDDEFSDILRGQI